MSDDTFQTDGVRTDDQARDRRPPMMLWYFARDHFFPGRYGPHTPRQTISKYQRAIKNLDNMLGRAVTTLELNDDLIELFRKWYAKCSDGEYQAKKYAQHIRTLANDARSHGFETGKVTVLDPQAAANKARLAKRRIRSGPSKRVRKMMVHAARLLAENHNATQIAKILNVSQWTVMNWRKRHDEFWNAIVDRTFERSIEQVRKQAVEHNEGSNNVDHHARAIAAERHCREKGIKLFPNREGDFAEGPTLREFVKLYSLERELADNSIYQYEQSARCFELWAGGPTRVAKLTRNWVNEWLRELSAGGGMSLNTVRCRRTHLLVLWRAAYWLSLCPEYPHRIRTVTVPHKPPEAWNLEEVQKLLATVWDLVRGVYYQIGMQRMVFWDLLIRIAWDTGLRQSDIFKLRRRDIGDEGRIVVVQGKTRRWTEVKLNASTLALVAEQYPEGDSIVVPWEMSHEYFRQQFAKIVFAARLTGSFKKFRKSSASNVELLHPGSGSSHLGHSPTSGIAREHYLDPRIVNANLPVPQELPVMVNGNGQEGGAA